MSLNDLSSNKQLVAEFTQLTNIAKQKFDIDLSVEQLLQDQNYQNLVISELASLNVVEVDQSISRIKLLMAAASTAVEKSNSKQSLTKPLIGIAAMVLILVSGFIFWSTQQPQTNIQPLAVQNNVAEAKVAHVESSQTAATPAKLAIPVTPAPLKPTYKTLFKLSGSNTIGEKLAPALIEAFLQERGATDLEWQDTESKLDKRLRFVLNEQHLQIEMSSHGSSTGFSALKEKSTDAAMSSRRIKKDELVQLHKQHGNLSKIGNEHIIGLDGLAIIVNQNNNVKQLTIEQVAKIYAGEITNWRDLGGADLTIQVLARDSHSGTWDTFNSLVLKKYQLNLTNTATKFESSSELSKLVSQNEAAIGFIGLNYIKHNKALAIAESAETNAIFPTRFTVGTEDYALARRLYLYTPTASEQIVKDFAAYAISYSGQNIVDQVGLISQNIRLETTFAVKGAPFQYNQYAAKADRLSLTLRFQYGDQELDNKGKRDLQRLMTFIESNPTKRVILMGFSDSIGSSEQNQKLSLMRAKSIERELTARGVQVIDTIGLGEALPLASNDSMLGRERNRRVEVWVL